MKKTIKLLNKPHDLPKNFPIYETFLTYKELSSSPLTEKDFNVYTKIKIKLIKFYH